MVSVKFKAPIDESLHLYHTYNPWLEVWLQLSTGTDGRTMLPAQTMSHAVSCSFRARVKAHYAGAKCLHVCHLHISIPMTLKLASALCN